MGSESWKANPKSEPRTFYSLFSALSCHKTAECSFSRVEFIIFNNVFSMTLSREQEHGSIIYEYVYARKVLLIKTRDSAFTILASFSNLIRFRCFLSSRSRRIFSHPSTSQVEPERRANPFPLFNTIQITRLIFPTIVGTSLQIL